MTGEPQQRVNAALTTKSFAALRRLMERDELSKTEAVNRALQVYDYFQSVIDGGGMVMIKERDGDIQKVNIL